MVGDGKNSFILYADTGALVDMLTDEQAGQVFKAIFRYHRGEQNAVSLSSEAALVFKSIQIYLDRDGAKWEKVVERRKKGGALGAQYGKLGGRPRKNGSEEARSDGLNDENPHKGLENPLRGFENPLKPLKTPDSVSDSVSVNVSVSDSVSDSVNVKDKLLEPLKPTPAKTAGAEDVTPYSKIMHSWNEICTSCGRIQGINGERRKLTRARWKEHPDLDWWSDFFAEIEQSDFLTGRVENGKWKVSYDWVIKPNNCDKIIEGRYKNRVIATPLTDRATTDYDF